MKEHRSFIKKLNSKGGFSLTETLTTLIIMSLVGMMVTAGITTSSRVYKEITLYSNAQLLLSNTITVLHDELVYALPDTVVINGDSEIKFEHVKNSFKTIKFNDAVENKGICISYGENSDTFYPLVSYQNKTSLYNDWKVSEKETDVYNISVSVYKADGTKIIEVENYEIKLLNG